jgi:hypothetical protein
VQPKKPALTPIDIGELLAANDGQSERRPREIVGFRCDFEHLGLVTARKGRWQITPLGLRLVRDLLVERRTARCVRSTKELVTEQLAKRPMTKLELVAITGRRESTIRDALRMLGAVPVRSEKWGRAG